MRSDGPSQPSLRMPNEQSEVVILGYDSRRIAGGVIAVTEVLVANQANVTLHPIKHCYTPKALDLWLYFLSYCQFVGLLVRRRRSLLVHLIVASRGDRVRAVPVILACSLFRVPLCIQYHKNVDGLFLAFGRHSDRLIDSIVELGDLHVFLSSTLQREFLERLPAIRRSTVINNALSKSWMGLPVRPLDDRDIDIVFFGRWNAEKGIDELVAFLESTDIPIRCEIYSDHVPEMKIKNAVIRPWAAEEQVRAALGRSRVLVLPSHFEAYPTVLLEALACGTPFVATNVGGIPDIARESEGGVLVEPGNAAALGMAIEALLADRAGWLKRSAVGWAWVNQTCNIERVLSLWKDAYASLESARRP